MRSGWWGELGFFGIEVNLDILVYLEDREVSIGFGCLGRLYFFFVRK